MRPHKHGGRFGTAEPEVKLGISPAKTPRPQRSENNNKQFFQDNLSFLRNLACFAPWRESSLLIASFMSNNECLHLRGTILAFEHIRLKGRDITNLPLSEPDVATKCQSNIYRILTHCYPSVTSRSDVKCW